MGMKFEDVDAFVAELPDVGTGTSWGNTTYTVRNKVFAWRRPFSKADLKRYGDRTPPKGDILGVRVESLDAKDALLAMDLPGLFTIPHFDGFAAVLIELRKARAKDVRTLLAEAHRVTAARASRPRRRG
jgi:hypothetical protein